MDVAEEMPIHDLEVSKRAIEKIEEFDRSYRKWHKPSKRGSEGEGEYRLYLKPPKTIKRQNSNGSCSSDLSDDASSFLSSSCISSCSDLSEYDSKSKHSANSTLKGSPNSSAGNIKVEYGMKGEVVDPVELIKEH